MRVRTLEIRWHGGDPIYACDFQPLPQNVLKKLITPRISQKDSSTPSQNPSSSSAATSASTTTPSASVTSQAFRFATAGSDNVVRIWMIHPNMVPPSTFTSASSSQPPPNPPPPRAEYLATLRKHTGAVNVARFSPNGEQLASAGDDGWIIVWTLTDRPVTTFGADPEEAQYEKEHWKPIITIKSTSREVYDLAWSPNGEYIMAGSTDNTARIYNASDSTCVREITEHNHYVQGVAWDPLNEFLASQSSDRAVHVYSVTTKRGPFEVHAIGKNSRLSVKHSRTPSGQPSSGRTHSRRRGSTSDAESVITTASEMKDEQYSVRMPTPSSTAATPSVAPITIASTPITSATQLPAPPTPSGSITSTPSAAMFPKPQSRRSSFSGSNAPSPAHSARHIGRSPSPMPPLPAIRTAPTTSSWASFKMYGDESYTNFFRRLTFSPDGAFLLTPAGHFEDPTVYPTSSSKNGSSKGPDDPPARPKKSSKASKQEGGSKSSVYIYSRANFSRPPVAHLPGHQKASVAVKFSPLLYELRPGVTGAEPTEVKKIAVERGKDQIVDLQLGGGKAETSSSTMQPPPPVQEKPVPSSASSDTDFQPATPNTPATASVFALPYRMLYAVATQDTVMIYDTQQAGPVCMFTNLHYTSFTDMAWAPDGQSLMLASSDGYCTIVVFDEILPLHHTQQHNLQLQSIAQSHTISPQQPHHSGHGTATHGHSASQSSLLLTPHSPALSISSSLPPVSTPAPSNHMTPLKRSDRSSSISSIPRTPSSSSMALGMDNVSLPESTTASTSAVDSATSEPDIQPPAKKRRRIALTHHPDTE